MIELNIEKYELISRPFKNIRHGVQLLNISNKLITIIVYLIYPLILIMLIMNKDRRFWKVLLIPAICFVVVSLFRSYVNLPRPYEILNINPLISKDTKGKSFPSRHVSSIFIIAMTLYYISIPVGIVLMFMGVILAAIRVVGGVHFPKDVIIGAIFGIIFGILAWNIIPV